MKIQIPYLNKNQRTGILALVVLIVLLQAVIFLVKYTKSNKKFDFYVDKETQHQIDSLKKLASKKYEMQPFNPNFITDAKGFRLGMSTDEIDRLFAFRATGKYVNSAAEFQKVTGISAELLAEISPYFKFPEWTQNQKTSQNSDPIPVKKVDLNKATYDDLVAIKGIGDYFANAILAERERLNGFVSVDQLAFIKALRPETIVLLKRAVTVKTKPKIVKVNVNTASKEDLAKVPYLNSYLARQIVLQRSKQEESLKVEDLEKIRNFPLDKLQIIKLYLDF